MPATSTTRATSQTYHIPPLIRRDAPGYVWGLSTRRLLLRHVRPHKLITYLPSYVGTHPAMYGVCQHAGYSYDTCDLTSISHISSHTSGRAWPRMRSVNTPATPTTRATSQAYHISLLIRPHTSGRTRPRMRSINTPAPLIRRDAPGHV
ncbi:unnamed protein product [Prunus armeniaca]